MDINIYKYRMEKGVLYLSTLYFVVFIILGASLYFLYEGGYFSAWFCSFVVAVIALMSLSIPRKIVVSDQSIRVRSLLDVTEIEIEDIASIKAIDRGSLKFTIPIFAGYGFFGYYGHFLNLRSFERVTIYASKWHDFIEITDVYDDKLYITTSCRDVFIADVEARIKQKERKTTP